MTILADLEKLAKAAEVARCIMAAQLTGQTHMTVREQQAIYSEYQTALDRLTHAMPPTVTLKLLAVARAAQSLADDLTTTPMGVEMNLIDALAALKEVCE